MRQFGHEVSEVVDLPLVIDTELDEIARRRIAVGLGYPQTSSTECEADDAPCGDDSDDSDATHPDASDSEQAARERIQGDLVGLAFSGGGIRSASFNLGMFQALYRAGFIRHADYLSTVSGGGYIGAHIASLMLGNDVKMDRTNFPLAPKESGQQPDRVIDFIRCGKYLVRQPLKFARWYVTGVVLNNLVLLSGLIALALLVAMIWRSLDTWPLYGVLRSATAGWSADWNRPFFVAAFAFLFWMAVKSLQHWRSRGRRDGGLATWCLLVFYGCLAIALGVLLGNGDIAGFNWTDSQSKQIWIPMLSILGVMLLPLLRPWRLLHSGTRPASKAETAVFKLTSYALLAGVPLALIAYFAHENISGYSHARADLVASDIHDWRFLGKISAPVQAQTTDSSDRAALTPAGDVTLLASYQQANSPLPAVFLEAVAGDTPISSTAVGAMIQGDNEATQAFLKELIDHLNYQVIHNKDFALAAAGNVNDKFWEILNNKEKSWWDEVAEEPFRRDVSQEFATDQTIPPARKAELTAMANALNAGKSFDEEQLALFNRLYLEAAFPNYIINRNRVLRSIVAVPDQQWRFKWFCVSLAIFVVGLVLVDPNVTSIHRYYSRELSRAYIEPVDGMGREIPMCLLDTVSKGAPYLLVNATVNLYGRRESNLEPRDIFVFSRKFCGSPSTRFCPSRQYLGGTFDLANAMAISGGAVTTSSVSNPLVAVMMFVLNFRLGQWLPNPREQSAFSRPALWQVVVDLFRETKNHSFCFVSDGGHYENLGATALLDRKCKVIVISDAGQDGHHVFADFVKLYRNLRTRSGVQFFDLETGGPLRLDQLMLRDPADDTHRRGQQTEKHFIPMGIRYQDGSLGLLVYVKPSFDGDEEVDLESYRASNPEFPHQPTSDQMYDEIQFESYRQLGFHIGSKLCGGSVALWDADAEVRISLLAQVLAGTDWEQIERAASRSRDARDRPQPTTADDGEKKVEVAKDAKSLLDQFRQGDAQIRVLALKELVSLQDDAEVALPELIADLRKAVKHQSMPASADRAQLAWAIGTFGPQARAAARPLITWLGDPSPEVRAASAEALGEIGVTTQVAQKALQEATRDDVEIVREAAEAALRLLKVKSSSETR